MSNAFIVTKWIFLGLRWVYEDITNGHIVLTICIFTIVMRLLTIFGDIQSRKSSAKMQAVQPELQKLQKKYANNPQKLQQAQSKLMKERGVSMMGGCLPMLITMPLFIIFLAAFRHWGYEQMARVIVEMDQAGTSALFPTFQWAWIHNIWQPDNGFKPVVMAAEEFLKTPELRNLLYFAENPEAVAVFERLGFFVEDVKNIPQASIDNYTTLMAPLAARFNGVNNGWFLLPVLSGGTSFLTSWLMQRGQPKSDAEGPTAGMNKSLLYVMPIMSFFICLSYNSAFGIYWTISNVVSIATNMLLNKKFKKDRALAEEGRT